MTVIRLSKTQPEHILLDETPLCGANCADANTRTVEHDVDPQSCMSIPLAQYACVSGLVYVKI